MLRTLMAAGLVVLGLGVVSANAAPVQFSGNGHYYDLIFPANGGSLTWTEAKLASEAQGGYLATVTSAEENNFLGTNFASQLFDNGYIGHAPHNSLYAWIGLSAPVSSPLQWSWVNGESSSYTNWAPLEPYPDYGSYGYVHYWVRDFGDGPNFSWNNEANEGHEVLNDGNRYGYFVEFDAAAPNAVPEPSTFLLLLVGVGVCVGLRKWKN